MSIPWFILHALCLAATFAGRAPAGEAKPRAILAGVKPTQISAANFSPDGKTLALHLLSGGVMLRDMASGKIVHTIEAGVKLGVVVFSPDSRLLATWELRATAERKQIKVWDVRTGKKVQSITGLSASSIFLGFTADSASLVVAQADELKQVSLATRKESTLCKIDNLRRGAKAICPDGKTLAVLTFEEIRFLDLMTGKELATVAWDWDNFGSPAFSGDGKTFAWVDASERIHVFDIPAGKTKTVLQDRGVSFGWIRLSHEGKTLYCQTEEAFERRNVATGMRIEGPEIALAESRLLALSPNGKLLATLSRDDELRLWEIDSGKEISSPKGHAKPVMSLAFAPDGKPSHRRQRAWSFSGMWGNQRSRNLSFRARERSASFSARMAKVSSAAAAVGWRHRAPLSSGMWSPGR